MTDYLAKLKDNKAGYLAGVQSVVRRGLPLTADACIAATQDKSPDFVAAFKTGRRDAFDGLVKPVKGTIN